MMVGVAHLRTTINRARRLTSGSISILLLATLALAGQSPIALAQANDTINFQGKIVNIGDGTNLVAGTPACVVGGASNDTCDFRVSIYDEAAAGNLLWQETHTNIEIGSYNGVFNLQLNSICGSWSAPSGGCSGSGITWGADSTIYLELEFAPAGSESFDEVFTRKLFNSVPYAYYADSAGSIAGFTADGFVQLAPGSAQVSTSTNSLVNLESTATGATAALISVNENGSGSPDLLTLQQGGSTVFNVNNSGFMGVGTSAASTSLINGLYTQTSGNFDPYLVTTTNDTTGSRTYGMRSVINTGASNNPGSLRAIRGEINYNSTSSSASVIAPVSGFLIINEGTLSVARGGTVQVDVNPNATAVDLFGSSQTVRNLGGTFTGKAVGSFAQVTTTTASTSEDLTGAFGNILNSGTVTGTLTGVESRSTTRDGSTVAGIVRGFSTYTTVEAASTAGFMRGIDIDTGNFGTVSNTWHGASIYMHNDSTDGGNSPETIGYYADVYNPFAGSTMSQMIGANLILRNEGTITGDISGLIVDTSAQNGTVNGDVYGIFNDVTNNGTVSGNIYGMFSADGTTNTWLNYNATYGLYTDSDIRTDASVQFGANTGDQLRTSAGSAPVQDLYWGDLLICDASLGQCGTGGGGGGGGTTPDNPNNLTYVTDTGHNFLIGGDTLGASKFQFNVSSTNFLLGGDGAVNNPSISFGDTNFNQATFGMEGGFDPKIYFATPLLIGTTSTGGNPTSMLDLRDSYDYGMPQVNFGYDSSASGNNAGDLWRGNNSDLYYYNGSSVARINSWLDAGGGDQYTMGNLGVGGSPSGSYRMEVSGNSLFNGNIESTGLTTGSATFNGEVTLNTIGASGSVDLCLDGSNIISDCSSSRRYKHNIENLTLGLDAVKALRPVTFTWNDSNDDDLGFVAEEAGEVSDLFVNYKDGQIEGVRYKQLTAVLVKAVQEQQTQIDSLKVLLAKEDKNATVEYAKALIKGDITIGGKVYVSSDTAGLAKILAGDTKVRINFSSAYASRPVVTITPEDYTGKYKLTEVSESGFTIEILRSRAEDLTFNWQVLGVNQGRVVSSH
jgi:hypothetical protein